MIIELNDEEVLYNGHVTEQFEECQPPPVLQDQTNLLQRKTS